MTASEEEIFDLLERAGAAEADDKARSELVLRLQFARSLHRAAKQRPTSAEQNELLKRVSKAANAMENALVTLRRQPHAWSAFWLYGTPHHAEIGFGPVEGNELERGGVRSVLAKIKSAADEARLIRKGRRRRLEDERVVEMALVWFRRFADNGLQGSREKFTEFAERFYEIALDTIDPKLDVPIANVWSRQDEIAI